MVVLETTPSPISPFPLSTSKSDPSQQIFGFGDGASSQTQDLCV